MKITIRAVYQKRSDLNKQILQCRSELCKSALKSVKKIKFNSNTDFGREDGIEKWKRARRHSKAADKGGTAVVSLYEIYDKDVAFTNRNIVKKKRLTTL